MENPNFSLAQVSSNDHVPTQHSTAPIIEEMEYIGCPNGYNTY